MDERNLLVVTSIISIQDMFLEKIKLNQHPLKTILTRRNTFLKLTKRTQK